MDDETHMMTLESAFARISLICLQNCKVESRKIASLESFRQVEEFWANRTNKRCNKW